MFEELNANSASFLSALIGAVIGAIIPWMFGRKLAWNDAREQMLKRLEVLYFEIVKMSQNPGYINHSTFQFLMNNESIFFLHESKSFMCKRHLLKRLSTIIMNEYVSIVELPDNEFVLLTQKRYKPK